MSEVRTCVLFVFRLLLFPICFVFVFPVYEAVSGDESGGASVRGFCEPSLETRRKNVDGV